MGIVSRGGSILARWMLKNDRENPLLTDFDRLLGIARRHNVTLSLGDGLRPGAGCDAGDPAQWEEVITLGTLARRALKEGVQCMIEGPGHVPMNEVEAQIRGIKKATFNAPLYVLGPLTTDCGRTSHPARRGGCQGRSHGLPRGCPDRRDLARTPPRPAPRGGHEYGPQKSGLGRHARRRA